MINLSPTLILTVKKSNNSSTKSARVTRHETYETWDAYDYVKLETPEASEQ